MSDDVTSPQEEVEETPVTEETSEEDGQETETPTEEVEEPPKKEPTNEEAKKERVKKKKQAISQKEWQNTQDEVKRLRQESDRNALDKFEEQNPIVKSEKYKDKWAEILEQKKTPGHRYAALDYQELLNLIRDTEPVEPKTVEQPVTIPSFDPSASPTPSKGKMSDETRRFMSTYYSQEELEQLESVKS